ncbi:MAG: TIGR04282 family arsenosugar biosynthesis glycosyltransferase [Phycisphaerae bacterium]
MSTAEPNHRSAVAPVAVVLVAKAPIPGSVKTRLTSHISAQAAAEIHAAFLDHVRRTAEQWASETVGIELVLLFAPPEDISPWDGWNHWRKLPQRGGDLGHRMEDARHRVSTPSHAGCIFIGADVPELTPDHLAWAAAEVNRGRYAMIPAHDGGYVLIGVPRFKKSLFDGIAWGTAEVASQTRRAAAQHDETISELPPMHDIDTCADLTALLNRLAASPESRALSLQRRLAELISHQASGSEISGRVGGPTAKE